MIACSGKRGAVNIKNNIDNQLEKQQKLKGMEHVPNIFMSFDKYLFLEVINILI